jgi:GDPmannose 4,6-dehydratase
MMVISTLGGIKPAEVDLLIGNPEKVKIKLGWDAKLTLEKLSDMMVQADLKRVKTVGVSF